MPTHMPTMLFRQFGKASVGQSLIRAGQTAASASPAAPELWPFFNGSV